MANLIQICLIFSTSAIWFTDAYAGIRHKRNKILHENEINSLKNKPILIDKTLVDENDENNESSWFYPQRSNIENENVVYNNQMYENINYIAYDDMRNRHAQIALKEINENEKPSTEKIEDNSEKKVDERKLTDEKTVPEEIEEKPVKKVVKRYVDNEENTADGVNTWADLFISFSKLAHPYLPDQVNKLNLDWKQLEVAVRSFSYVTSSDVTERSLNNSPLMATIRATTAAATPMIMDGVRAVLSMLLDFVDNAGFVTNGHAISRRGVSESVLDDIMDAFTAILEHMTGTESDHHNYIL